MNFTTYSILIVLELAHLVGLTLIYRELRLR